MGTQKVSEKKKREMLMIYTEHLLIIELFTSDELRLQRKHNGPALTIKSAWLLIVFWRAFVTMENFLRVCSLK